MTERTLYTAALGVCLGVVLPGLSQDARPPARLPVSAGVVSQSTNQQMADAIARQLNQSPRLKQFRINIAYQNGIAHLTGAVTDPGQREEAGRIVQALPGVTQVLNQLQVAQAGEVVRTQAQPPEIPQVKPTPVPPGVNGPLPPGALGPFPFPPGVQPQFPPPPGTAPPLPNVGGIQEPLPLGQQVPPGFPSGMQPPPMPPYAWPTYAPYNNYSRVAYPTLYPYESWPYIGPMYPFPRVPLGWRSVCLTWEDGHWWYGQRATGHDWWRIRYW